MSITKRHACFAATTPYQIIGAISITINDHLDADLYLFGMFNGYNDVASRIEKEKIFKNVYCIDPGNFQFTKKSVALKQIIRYRDVVSTFLPSDIAYEVFYTTSRAHVKTLMIHELKRRNPNMSYVIYEDGIGMYRPGKLAIVTSKKRQIFESVLGWRMFEPDRTVIMAYEPALVEASPGISNSPIMNMPRINWNSEENNIVNRVFAVDNDKQITERIIIFDNIRVGNDEKDKLIDSCISTVLEIANPRDVICKPHPRSLSFSQTGVRIYSESGVPMEALYSSMDDMGERILISCTSTAAMTPKLLFGQEPYIFDIYQLVSGQANSVNEAMLDKIESMYTDKSKVIRIKSYEELKTSIARILSIKIVGI